jgi:carbamoyltransferase
MKSDALNFSLKKTSVNAFLMPSTVRVTREKTGYGIVLNTSFNDKGEPIVNTPREALNMFLKTEKLDTLFLENYKIEKATTSKSL